MKGGRRLDALDEMRRAVKQRQAGESAASTDRTSGELAARAGVTAEAIRSSEREGLVSAVARGGAGRYRRYKEADTCRRRFIRRVRDLGFSLEVRGLLDVAEGNQSVACANVNRIARSHLGQVDAKLAQFTKRRTELDRVIATCHGVVPGRECESLAVLDGDE
jgi:MerR family mercuric resistance operon transcriptional regulator